MIVSNQLMSFESIKADLVNFVKTLDDYDVKWKDFYEGGAGTTLIQLISGVGAFLSYQAVMSRRESYLETAKLKSSVYGIANALSYPINRESAPVLKLTVSSSSTFTIDHEQSFGMYKKYPLSTISDKLVVSGSNVINCVIGEWKRFEVTSSLTKAFTFLVIEDLVDNDHVELFINGSLVELTKYAEELNPGNVLIKTFQYGVLLVFGDGSVGKLLSTSDVVSFRYVQVQSVTGVRSVDVNDIKLNFTTTSIVAESTTPGYAEDSLDKISVIASGYYTAKRRLITLSDHVFVAKGFQGIISANAERDQFKCCTVYLSYLFDHLSDASPTEKAELLAYMEEFALLGVDIILSDPTPIYVDVDMTIIAEITADVNEIRNLVQSKLQSMSNKLGETFHITSLLTETLPGARRIYLNYPISDRTSNYNQYFKLRNVSVIVTTDNTVILSQGTNLNLGYSA